MTKETAEYSISNSAGVSLSMGEDGEAVRETRKVIEMDTDDVHIDEDDNDDLVGADDDGGESDADTDGDDSGELEADAEGELGDFDPEDAAVVEAFDAKYLTADGDLDAEGSLSAEFFANAEKGIEGLNEATYEYLATKGVSKATVKKIEAMAATNAEAQKNGVAAQDHKLFEIAGGPDALKEALNWGRDGGYTKEQQDRFNKITKGKDLEAKQEAVEALMSRYKRANPTPKPTLPKRDATKGQSKVAPGAKPYASRQEMRKVRDALKDNDRAGWAAHNRRLAASKFD